MEEMYRKYHDVANIFPLITGEEFEELKQDIKANGLLEPIWLHPDDETIIDGRNRHRACCALGIQPTFRTWDGKGSLVAFVVSLNLRRRHLTSSQKAVVAVDILPLLEKEARERQREAGAAAGDFGYLGGRGNKRKPLPQKIGEGVLNEDQDDLEPDEYLENFTPNLLSPTPILPDEVKRVLNLSSSQRSVIAANALPLLEQEEKAAAKKHANEAAEQAAKLVGTNRQYVTDAKKIVEQAPEIAAKVRSGELSITQAKREVVKLTAPEPPPFPTGKYRVLYIDPPWKYSNTMPDYSTEQADHYPLMPLQDICAMPVKDLAEDDSVLFLWVTSPILEDSFQVIKAWGFKYKSSFVWDKVKHNMGHYNSVRHEFLLVCTRGSCQPDVQKLFDSVQTIERTEHSRKPEEFRQIIDTIYPKGARIELFARRAVDGWDTYGNEIPGQQNLES